MYIVMGLGKTGEKFPATENEEGTIAKVYYTIEDAFQAAKARREKNPMIHYFVKDLRD